MKLIHIFETGRTFTIGPSINKLGSPAHEKAKAAGTSRRPTFIKSSFEDEGICKKISKVLVDGLKLGHQDDEIHLAPGQDDRKALTTKWLATLKKGDLAGWNYDYNHDSIEDPDVWSSVVDSMFVATLGKGKHTYEEWAEKIGLR
jgi:hypothetical protein